MNRSISLALLVSMLFVLTSHAHADEVPDEQPQPTTDAPAVPAQDDANAEPELPWQPGPKQIDLGNGAELSLPDGFEYLAQPHATQVMERMGNLFNDGLLGLIVSSREEDNYLVTVRYDESGFIKDDEEIDGQELLEEIQDGEEDYNAERARRGFPAIHAKGWLEQPRYDRAQHRLVWGLEVADNQGSSVNYNTRILGRKGYVSLNMITDPAMLAQHKTAATQLLAQTNFVQGSRYQDYVEGTDKVAEYGLTGLVLGGAGFGLAKAAKIGLLAKFGKGILAVLIAGKKAIVAAIVGLGALVKKLFGGKQQEAQQDDAGSPPAA